MALDGTGGDAITAGGGEDGALTGAAAGIGAMACVSAVLGGAWLAHRRRHQRRRLLETMGRSTRTASGDRKAQARVVLEAQAVTQAVHESSEPSEIRGLVSLHL